jgi:hypothetical protein
LQRTINSARDLLDERISLAENIASDIDKVVRMRTVCGRSFTAKITVLGNRTVTFLMLKA